MLRKTLKLLIRGLFHLLAHIEIIGMENVPKRGSVILCANHVALVDAPLPYVILERDDVTGYVAKKHRKVFLYRWLVDVAGGIWLNRDEADAHAMRIGLEHIRKGGILGIAPEGTRSPNATMIPPKTGVAYLADKAGVPILPLAIMGTENLFKELKRLRRAKVRMIIGQPFNLPPVERRNREADLQRNTDEIMCRIAVMLDPSYRGIYADHPRLKELLAGNVAPEVIPEQAEVYP